MPDRRAVRLSCLSIITIVAVSLAVLRGMGRVWWCRCGELRLWTSDVVSSHNSQHLLDPYSLSHFQHGLVFYLLLWWTLRGRLGVYGRGVAMLALEALWELVENTPFTIERYRAATISLDYYGDSIFNSLGDLASCAAGYLFAALLPAWSSILMYVAIEAAMLLAIRDSLILNVIMLVAPSDAIKAWQQGS